MSNILTMEECFQDFESSIAMFEVQSHNTKKDVLSHQKQQLQLLDKIQQKIKSQDEALANMKLQFKRVKYLWNIKSNPTSTDDKSHVQHVCDTETQSKPVISNDIKADEEVKQTHSNNEFPIDIKQDEQVRTTHHDDECPIDIKQDEQVKKIHCDDEHPIDIKQDEQVSKFKRRRDDNECEQRKNLSKRHQADKQRHNYVIGDFLLIVFFENFKRKVGLVKLVDVKPNEILQGKWYHVRARQHQISKWEDFPLHDFDETNIIASQNVVIDGQVSSEAWAKLIYCENSESWSENSFFKSWVDTSASVIMQATSNLGQRKLLKDLLQERKKSSK